MLVANAQVALDYCPSPTRKTSYDLIAVKKGKDWYNIDSQAPNELVAEALEQQIIQLEGLKGSVTLIKREVTFQHSKFDFYFETDQGEKGFIEVKGMTLENQQVGAFPDAPTQRGLKHVRELKEAQLQDYKCFVLFIAQFENFQTATIHSEMQPALHKAVVEAMEVGVRVSTYSCFVSETYIRIKQKVPFDVNAPFVDPNR